MGISEQQVVIVGAGTVGAATGQALHGIGHRVTLVDTDASRRDALAHLGLPVVNAVPPLPSGAIVMLCVQTPATTDGFDLAPLETAVRSIGAAIAHGTHDVIVAVRSTVPPGTCELAAQWLADASGRVLGDGYDLACMPEFLRHASAAHDAANPRVSVIAGPDPAAVERIARLVRPLGGTLHTSHEWADAELIKCAHNAYNATKISFWNEIHAIAGAVGSDSSVVAKAVAESAEASWNPQYGTTGGRPYEGGCLPKDVVGFAAHAAAAGIDPVVLMAVDHRNALVSRTPDT